jgi:hypothetical protein
MISGRSLSFSFRTLVLSLLVSLSVLMAAPAQAYYYGDGYESATEHGGGHSGTCALLQWPGSEGIASEIFFCRYGDLFHIWDLDSDGKSVGAKWSTSNGHAGLCRFSGGSGDAGDCNYDFPENVTVTFYGGLCNQTATVDCHSWSQYTDKTGPASITAG